MRGFVIVSVLIAMLLIMPLVIFAQCECTEQSREHIYRGGDDLHLSWYSLQRQEHDGDPTGDPPPIFCYERKVQNRTDQEVTDIYWPIAGYQKKILPAQSLKCCCDSTSVPGPIKQPLPQGPLYYGPGNSHYSTTVYQPRDGWQTRTANFRPMELVAEYPALTSGMQLAIRTSNGEVTVSNVKLQSKLYFITTPEKLYEYLYEFRNVGTEPLYIFLDIPKGPDFRGQFDMDTKDPLYLPPNKSVIRSVKSKHNPTWVNTTASIYDINGDVISRSIVPVYGFSEGKVERGLLKDWDLLQER